ncbi:MAG: DsrE/DsrF/DrsH-like family protein [bacterium]
MSEHRRMSLILFSGEMDKTLAALVLATGAASMGYRVTVFCTFWGLNLIKKSEAKAHGGMLERMMAVLNKGGVENLPLSRMNMLGVGPRLLKKMMKGKNVASLKELLDTALELGVQFVACQMSMDVMGLTKEDLAVPCELGGVATFLNEAGKSQINLFV